MRPMTETKKTLLLVDGSSNELRDIHPSYRLRGRLSVRGQRLVTKLCIRTPVGRPNLKLSNGLSKAIHLGGN